MAENVQHFYKSCIGRYNLLQARQGIGCSLIFYLICPATSLRKMRQGRSFPSPIIVWSKYASPKEEFVAIPSFPLLSTPWACAGEELWGKHHPLAGENFALLLDCFSRGRKQNIRDGVRH